MSGSDAGDQVFSAISDIDDPPEALRGALGGIARAMAAAGVAPSRLGPMTWRAPDPSAFHIGRHDIDLAFREVFPGFRPTIALVQADEEGLTVEARIRPPSEPPRDGQWHGLSQTALVKEYSPRSQVADVAALFRKWREDGAAARAAHDGLDISYGPSIWERFDFYRPRGVRNPPLWIYLHGGFWQALDKDGQAQFMQGMLDAGFAVANLDYGLAPETNLEGIVAQIRHALSFLVSEAGNLGFDSTRMHIAGHSAGGHLAAMMACDRNAPPLRSALLLSGLFEMQPIALLPMGPVLGLTDEATIARMSPVRMPAPQAARIGAAVGGKESDEFKWHTEEITRVWRARPSLIVADANHMSLLDGLIAGELLDYALALAD